MLGDWLNEQTTVSQVAGFVDRVYVRKDLKGFTGDPRFVRNDWATKTFSKLRSSIAGVYAWRLGASSPPEYQPKSKAESQALVKAADLAFRQAFALCPYSPEAVFRYTQFLLQFNRMDDATLIAETSVKLDPQNNQLRGLLENLKSYRKQSAGMKQTQASIQHLEDEVRNNPTNLQSALDLASADLQMQQTNRAIEAMDGLLANPRVNASAVLAVAQAYTQMQNLPKLESALEKLVKVTPASPEAWYDLAALKANLNKFSEALAALKQALELSTVRLQGDPKARDLRETARKDARFDALRQSPDFQTLMTR
jgi:tetratricopeptide (TPR) repeat protein